MISLLVPFRPDGAERDRNWKWLEGRYRALYPDWEIAVGLHDEGEWCKGAAVRDALERSSGDKLIITDADMILVDEVMREAVARLDDRRWVVPHRRAFRLKEQATVQVIEGTLDPSQLTHDHIEIPPRAMYPCGGMFFVRRDAYLDSGGFDERFRGWGGEDESLGMKMETLYGPPVCLESVLFHLFHQPQPDMPSDRLRPAKAQELVGQYEDAFGNPDLMRALG